MKKQSSSFHLNTVRHKLILFPGGINLLRNVLVFLDTDITGECYDVLGKIGLILDQYNIINNSQQFK